MCTNIYKTRTTKLKASNKYKKIKEIQHTEKKTRTSVKEKENPDWESNKQREQISI